MTTAEKIAARYDWDGQTFKADDGQDISDLCHAQAWTSSTHRDSTVYRFVDDSYIVINECFWDLLTLKDGTLYSDGAGAPYVAADPDGDPDWAAEVSR